MTINQTTGVYTPAAGATSATPGQVVQSAVWDNVHTDMSSGFTTTIQALQSTFGWRNLCFMNGSFEIWQRGAGTSSSIAVGATTTAYTSDRWYLATGANQASVVAAVTGIVNGSRLAAKVQRNNGQAGTTQMFFGFPFDGDESAMMAGQIVALSFTAKAGANFSPTSGTLSASLNTGTGAPVKFSGGTYAGAAQPIAAVACNLTTSATRFTMVSTAVPTTVSQAEVTFTWTPVGTAGADDSFTIDDVQLEILPNATSPIAQFERLPFEFQRTMCKRHYRKSFAYGTAPAQNAGLIGASILIEQAATASCFWIPHPITMRTTPTFTTFNPAATNANANSNSAAATLAVSIDSVGINSPDIGMIYVTSSGASAGAFVAIHWQADAGI